MLTLHPLFSAGAVLQAGKPLPVWGRAEAGSAITVSLQGESATCVAGPDRCWRAVLPPLKVSFDETLSVTGAGEHIVTGGIAVGGVWLACGQSNMEFPMRALKEFRRLAQTNLSAVRLYSVPRVSYPGQLEEDDFSEYRVWRACTPDQLWYYPAVPFYFAMRLFAARHVPIGIINCTVGGSTAAAWADPALLEQTRARVWVDEYERAIEGLDLAAYTKQYKSNPMFRAKEQDHSAFREKMWRGHSFPEGLFLRRRIRTMAANMPMPVVGPLDYNRPGALYENMVRSIAPFAARGVLWYQGEADERHPEAYADAMDCVVDSWRRLWGDALPFLTVQIAPYAGFAPFEAKSWPLLRQEQAAFAARKDGVFLTNAMDEGMKNDIHPKNKRPVGERLALLARGAVYGEAILCRPPAAQGAQLAGDALHIRLSNCETGLWRSGRQVAAWQVFADGAPLRGFRVTLRGGGLTIRHGRLRKAHTVEVRYGWTNYCRCTLVNGAHIPIQPFRLCLERVESGKTQNERCQIFGGAL